VSAEDHPRKEPGEHGFRYLVRRHLRIAHAEKLHAVAQADALLAAGLVSLETEANPGHGTQKVLRAVAARVDLHVLID
jgi:hypothetical protein